MKKFIGQIAVLAAVLGCVGTAYAAEDTIENKVIAGYQAWFNTEGDGSPRNSWVHWGTPEAGKITFDAYPDVRDYSEEGLAKTRFAALGNGKEAKLFSSYNSGVIDKHFEMMCNYGIDGVAVQRFGMSTIIGDEQRFRGGVDILKNVRVSAEKYNRLFYVMYDISGLSSDNLIEAIERDWQEAILDQLDLISSEAYATDNGRPVVCLWGLGIREGAPEQYSELIDWLHEKGCYVIGGVSKNWRSQIESNPGYAEVFEKLDMLSPWIVGGMKTDKDIDENMSVMAADKEYLDAHDTAYQPVVFPGFSWSNWKDNAVRNQIPRRAGDFMWRQVYDIARLDIPCAYIAMFDEYDEGTAILKLAEDSSMIPKDQYFLTASADGIYTSSDLYMRIAGYIPKVLRKEAELSEKMPLPLSAGPVYFRSGFEKYFDAQPVSDTQVVKDEQSYNGRYSLKITEPAVYKISELNFDAPGTVHIGIGTYLADSGLSVEVGLETSDGSVSYAEAELAGNKWIYNSLELAADKHITGLVIKTEGSGKVYIDDVVVTTDSAYINTAAPGSKYDLYARNLYNLGMLEGEGDNCFEMHLGNAVTREQAVKAIMGVIGEKADESAQCPFNDLSSWSVPYVAKAYEKGIVDGVDSTTFNAGSVITKREATTILLRALGYPGDAYADCALISVESGLYKDSSMTADLDEPLNYDELVFLAYRALFTPAYGEENVMLGKLMQNGIITSEALNKETDVLEDYNMTLKPPAKVIFNSEYFYNLMNITVNSDSAKGDSYTKQETRNGVDCVVIPEKNYMYCQVSDAYITPADSRVKVSITYLDEGTGSFGIHYNSSDEALEGNAKNYKNAAFSPRTNSGEWKTQSVILDDAAFNNKQNSGADLRVYGAELHIKEIDVEKL